MAFVDGWLCTVDLLLGADFGLDYRHALTVFGDLALRFSISDGPEVDEPHS